MNGTNEALAVGVIVAVVQGVKQLPVFGSGRARRCLPLAVIFVGILTGVAMAALTHGGDVRAAAVRGIAYAMAASGLFSWCGGAKGSTGKPGFVEGYK